MATVKEVDDFKLNNSKDLCAFAEMLGYRGIIDQLQNSNGAYVSSLLAFIDDNPGLLEEIKTFVLEKFLLDEEDEETEEFSEYEEPCNHCGADVGEPCNPNCESLKG